MHKTFMKPVHEHEKSVLVNAFQNRAVEHGGVTVPPPMFTAPVLEGFYEDIFLKTPLKNITKSIIFHISIKTVF